MAERSPSSSDRSLADAVPPSAGAAAPQPRHAGGTGWRASALAATMIAATVPQFALGAFGPRIADDIGLTVADIGIVVGTLYCLSVPVSLVAGRVVDRIGARRGLVAVLSCAAVATVLTITAGSRSALLVGVIPAALAMAGCTPVTNRLAREAPRLATRNLLVSFAQTGVQLGAVIIGLLGLVGTRLGWRPLVSSILIVIAVAATTAAMADRRDDRHRQNQSGDARRAHPDEAGPSTTGSGPGARSTPTSADRAPFPVAVLTLLAMVMALPGGTTIAYLATYSTREVGLDASVAAGTALAFGAMALLSRASIGRLLRSDRAVLTALTVMALGGATAMALIAVAPAAPSLVWVGAALFGAAGLTWPTVLMISVVRRTASAKTASTTGTILAAFYLGQWIGPLVAAAALGRGVGFEAIWPVCVVLYLLGLAPLHLARQRLR